MRRSMGRILLVLTVLIQVCVAAPEIPGESDLLQEQVRNLGAEASHDRAAASKSLTAQVKALDEPIVTYLTNSSQNDKDGAPAKDVQSAMAEGSRFYRHLESSQASTKDPEVRFRLKEVLKVGRFSSAFFELGLPEQQLAIIPFETFIHEDGNAVSRRTYGREGSGITDLGNIRIVREGVSISGEASSSRVSIRHRSGSSSSSSGSGSQRFNFRTAGGLTTFDWGNTLHFSISNGVLKIDGRSIPFSDTPKIIFVSKKNKVTAVVKFGQVAK
jgi:hypothetical protein